MAYFNFRVEMTMRLALEADSEEAARAKIDAMSNDELIREGDGGCWEVELIQEDE